ncbi:unnamed protein product [Lathyrus oleraceus]
MFFISPLSSPTPSPLELLFHYVIHFATFVPNSTVVASSVRFCSARKEVPHCRPKKICSILYPGDATKGGILLRLKQQYFLCSSSLRVS